MKTIPTASLGALAGVIILTGILSSCVSYEGGGESVIQQSSPTPTTEQELQDLKTAYDKGIISEREYNQQRDRLLRR
jgi:hypothetical protein